LWLFQTVTALSLKPKNIKKEKTKMSHLDVVEHIINEYSAKKVESSSFDYNHLLSLLLKGNCYSELFSSEGDSLRKKWFKLIGALCHGDSASREFGLLLLKNSLPYLDHQSAVSHFSAISNNLIDQLKVHSHSKGC
jgi:hypothetical protein